MSTKSGRKVAGKDTNPFSKNDPRYWEKKIYFPTKKLEDRVYEAKIYHVRIQHQKRRKEFSTDESSKRAAGKRALDIYTFLRANDWDATVEKFCHNHDDSYPSTNLTVGEYLSLVEERSHLNPQTFKDYTVKFRRLVADISKVKLPPGVKKQDYTHGGAEQWRNLVDRTVLAYLTPEQVETWKYEYLRKAGFDPRKLSKARHTVNSIIRCSKALFAPKILKRLKDIELPSPLPFHEVEFEKESSMRYRSTFDPEKILEMARIELFQVRPEDEVVIFKGKEIPQTDRSPFFQRIRQQRSDSKHEAFKILLLSLCAGLRRNEIDKLQWSQFLFEESAIRIEETDCFSPKADSSGDVPIDSEVMDFFCDLATKSSCRFVINGQEPRLEAKYKHYRAHCHHQTLIAWLREKGVNTQCPIHTLRKEFGSILCRHAGLFVASRLLRHSNVAITERHYLDNQTRVVTGLGSILRKPV